MNGAVPASKLDRWVCVGRSMAVDGRSAGAEAAAAALLDRSAKLLIVFCSIHYDTAEVLEGICSVTPDDVLVVGGTSMGEIAERSPGLEEIGVGSAVVATALGGAGFAVSSSVVRHASADRRESGVAAASAMSGIDSPHKVLLMIVDGLTREQHELVRGAYSVLGALVPMVGGCSADNVEYALTNQFHGTGRGVEQLVDSIVAVGLGSSAPIGIGIAHGWAKQGEPMVVTSSDGGEVFLIDDEPALDVYLRRIGAGRSLLGDADAFRASVFDHPLGMSRRSGEDIRVVHSADVERGSLLCLADVPQGALVWTMTTDTEALVAAAGHSCEMAVDGLGGSAPLGVVVFDCGARKLKLGPDNVRTEQSAIARAAAGAPFAGFYTFGEIARTRSSRGMHHLTVVTLALA
ncbi:MAG: FIST signal transduction protein [Solirubrobacteraceae bacterium]